MERRQEDAEGNGERQEGDAEDEGVRRTRARNRERKAQRGCRGVKGFKSDNEIKLGGERSAG